MPVIETSENNSNEILKTRWYNNNYNEVKIAILKYAQANNAILNGVNDDYMEFLFNVNFKEYFVKCTEYKGLIAVDLKITTSFFKAKKAIIIFYEEINQFLKLEGLGLLA